MAPTADTLSPGEGGDSSRSREHTNSIIIAVGDKQVAVVSDVQAVRRVEAGSRAATAVASQAAGFRARDGSDGAAAVGNSRVDLNLAIGPISPL